LLSIFAFKEIVKKSLYKVCLLLGRHRWGGGFTGSRCLNTPLINYRLITKIYRHKFCKLNSGNLNLLRKIKPNERFRGWGHSSSNKAPA
jgi:hypothetical protein